MQRPFQQLSCSVQALPSSHVDPSCLTGFVQVPVFGSQTPASWHWSDAVQVTGVPAHCPAWQTSPWVHLSPSLHVVPSAVSRSAGQVSADPSHRSSGSQGPVEARQTSVRLWSAGQAAFVPEQVSATSHSPAAARHSVPAGTKASAGQAAFVPEQVSATSHSPAAARHSVPAGTRASAGQSLETPSQLSATSQSPAVGRHTPVLF